MARLQFHSQTEARVWFIVKVFWKQHLNRLWIKQRTHFYVKDFMQSAEIFIGKKMKVSGKKRVLHSVSGLKVQYFCSRYPWAWGCWPTAQISALLVPAITQANFLDLNVLSVNYLFWYSEGWKELISSSASLLKDNLFFRPSGQPFPAMGESSRSFKKNTQVS